MAKEYQRPNFDAKCNKCGAYYQAKTLDEMPSKCCYKLIINSHRTGHSRFKEELAKVLKSKIGEYFV